MLFEFWLLHDLLNKSNLEDNKKVKRSGFRRMTCSFFYKYNCCKYRLLNNIYCWFCSFLFCASWIMFLPISYSNISLPFFACLAFFLLTTLHYFLSFLYHKCSWERSQRYNSNDNRRVDQHESSRLRCVIFMTTSPF